MRPAYGPTQRTLARLDHGVCLLLYPTNALKSAYDVEHPDYYVYIRILFQQHRFFFQKLVCTLLQELAQARVFQVLMDLDISTTRHD